MQLYLNKTYSDLISD